MKIQNNKTKTATTIISTLVIGLVLLSPTMMIPNVNALQQINPSLDHPSGCAEQVLKGLIPDLTSDQQQRAILLAEKSTQFLKNVGSSGYKIFAVAPNYSFDPKTCSNFVINAVSVGFTLTNGSSLAIYEDDKISKVLDAKIPHTIHGHLISKDSSLAIHGNSNSTTWAGYQVYYQATPGQNSPELYSLTNYAQPSVTNNSACSNAQPYECDLSDWAGLDHSNNYLAQTGTDALINCQSGICYSPQYYGWWEFYSTSGDYSMNCPTGDVVNTSDSLQAISENGPIFGGSSNQFKTYLIDNTGSGWICSSGTYTWTNAPTPDTALAMVERPTLTGTNGYSYASALPTFSSISNTGNSECYGTGSGQCVSFYSSYSNNWYYRDQMVNCPPSYNIQVSSMDSSGNFVSTYKNSCGT